jgi:hypothetical protein
LDSSGSRWGPLPPFCEDFNERLGSIKRGRVSRPAECVISFSRKDCVPGG